MLQGAHQDPRQGRGAEVHRRGRGRVREHPRARRRRLGRTCSPTPSSTASRPASSGARRRARATVERRTTRRRRPTRAARRLHALARAQRAPAHARRLPRRDALAQARRPAAGRRHRPTRWMRAADLADRFSHGELRVSHDQNLVLPWVRASELPALWQAAREAGFATPNIGYLTDMIACPGGDFCALANARSIPIAAAITERFDDLDELYDIGDIDLHISGCINSCGHHHSGHIGILGVDKDGQEWYQVSLGGADGSTLSGAVGAGKVIGPSFAADEVPDVIEAVIDTYRAERAPPTSASSTRCGASASIRSRSPPMPCAAPRRTRERAGHEIHRRQPRPLARGRRRRSDRRRAAAEPAAADDRAVAVGARRRPADVPVGLIVPTTPTSRSIAADLPRLPLHRAAVFPKWADGRAYSQARLLRARYRFARRDPRHRRGARRHDAAAARAPASTPSRCAPTSRRSSPSARCRFFADGHYQGDVIEPLPRFRGATRGRRRDARRDTGRRRSRRLRRRRPRRGRPDHGARRRAPAGRRRRALRFARRPGAARSSRRTRAGSTSASAASRASRTRRAAGARTPARTRSTPCSSSTRRAAPASFASRAATRASSAASRKSSRRSPPPASRCEVVPGVTAALAAAAATQRPLTRRGSGRSVALTTAMTHDGELAAGRHADTEVVLHGRQAAGRAVAPPRSPPAGRRTTPVLVVSRAGWPDQLASDHTVATLATRPCCTPAGRRSSPSASAPRRARRATTSSRGLRSAARAPSARGP